MSYSEWKTYSLKDICTDISYGYTASAKEEKVGPKFLRITDLRNEFIDWESVPYCSINEKDYKKYKLEIGDLCIARTGATTGINTVIEEDVDAVFASYLVRFKLNKEIVDPTFIKYIFKSNMWYGYVNSIISGSAQPGANAQQMSNFKMSIPDLDEQKKIASVLSVLDKKIVLNNKINKTLEEMAQAIFKRWFVDFEFPNENGKPYKSSGGKFVESESGMIPEGWKEGTLDNLVVINTASVDPKENPEILYEHYSIPAFDEQKYPKFEYGREIKSNKYLVRPNSFLVSKLNPTTKRVWDPLCITENAISSTEFINYLPKDISYQSYLYCMLNSERFSEHLIKHATGSTGSRQRVKPAETLTFNVILPDTETLKKFDNLIRPIREKLKINQINSAVLKDVRDILLPKLMSGEIRVPDAEREVEECLQKSN
uniref:Restriction modification system DNA specificity domain protein n=1 Tax=Geobacillus sp. (strain WCH70) TaxID=471223 RepID=C5DAW6_GEOSW